MVWIITLGFDPFDPFKQGWQGRSRDLGQGRQDSAARWRALLIRQRVLHDAWLAAGRLHGPLLLLMLLRLSHAASISLADALHAVTRGQHSLWPLTRWASDALLGAALLALALLLCWQSYGLARQVSGVGAARALHCKPSTS